MTWFHIAQYDLILSDEMILGPTISYCARWFYIASCELIASCNVILSLLSYYCVLWFILRNMISYYILLFNIASYYLVLRLTSSYRAIQNYIASCELILHPMIHIVSCYKTQYYFTGRNIKCYCAMWK